MQHSFPLTPREYAEIVTYGQQVIDAKALLDTVYRVLLARHDLANGWCVIDVSPNAMTVDVPDAIIIAQTK